MVLYRIARCIYAGDLSGEGARLFGGRWNSKGKPALYMASNRALAVLEVLVHLPPLMIPDGFCLAEIDVPDDSIIKVSTELPANWNDVNPPADLKQFGDSFLKKRQHLLMKVPSSIVPAEFNYILNPMHPLIKKVKVIKTEPFEFDKRLQTY